MQPIDRPTITSTPLVSLASQDVAPFIVPKTRDVDPRAFKILLFAALQLAHIAVVEGL
jgi:hypothetical protein